MYWHNFSGSDKREALIRTTTLAALLGAVIGLAFFAVHRLMGFAGKRVASGMSRGISQEIAESESEVDFTPNTPYVSSAPANSVSPAAPAAPAPVTGTYARLSPSTSYSAPPNGFPMVTPPPPPAPDAPFTLFNSEAERRQAQAALSPLREVLQEVRRCNGQTFLNSAPSAEGEQEARAVPSSRSSNPVLPGIDWKARTQQIERVRLEVDALAAQIALCSHPDRIPIPLRDGVGEVCKELRACLQNAVNAAQDPEQSSHLQAASAQRLSRVEVILGRLDSLAGGGSVPGGDVLGTM